MASKESLRHYRNLHPKSTETTRPPRLSVISFNNCLTKFMDDIFDSKRFDHGNFSPQTLNVAVFFQFHSCLSFSYVSYDTIHTPTFSIRKPNGFRVNWVWCYMLLRTINFIKLFKESQLHNDASLSCIMIVFNGKLNGPCVN